MFGKRSQAKQQTKILNAIRVTSAILGQPIPILFGTDRLSSHILDYQDFVAIPVKGQNAGKGGLFGGGGSGAGQTYDYQAAVILALCEGEIENILNVWDSKGNLELVSAVETHTVPGGGGNIAVTNQGTNFYDHAGVSRTDPYSFSANDYGSPGSVSFSGNQQTPMSEVGSSPAAGQFTSDGTGNFGFAAADAGKSVQIAYTFIVPNTGDPAGTGPQQILSITLFDGALGQSPWSYMTSKHPGRDLGYTGIAYVAASSLDLGSSASLPNYSFETSALKVFGGGILDANPKDIISEIITNGIFGLGLDPSVLGDFTQFSKFCIAAGIFLSVLLDSQDTTANVIRTIMEITNSEQFFSEGVLKIVPYGDTTLVGNGQTYTPQTAPVYDLTDDDFMAQRGGPVVITRVDPTDAKNRIPIEFMDRSNSYNPDTVYDQDDASVAQAGLLQGNPLSYPYIKTRDIAQKVANHRMKRSVYIHKGYKFTLGPRYVRLEPMDLVTLTDSRLGLSKEPVRLTRTQETDQGFIQCEAEEFPWGTTNPTIYPKQLPDGTSPDYFADPGNANAPIIFEPNNRLSHQGSLGTQQGYQIWMGLSGASDDWGGCNVWMSVDAGASYRQIGSFISKSRMGVLSASLASSGDPDTTHTLSVDVSESKATLLSGSATDCDNFRTLCYVDGEYISYQDANLTSAYHYNLTTRLRRGVFGSPIGAHSNGTDFLRLDDPATIFAYVYDPTLIGASVLFKFTSFNRFGQMEQAIANVSSYGYTVLGQSELTGLIHLIQFGYADVSGLGTVIPANSKVDFTGAQSHTGLLSTDHITISLGALALGWDQVVVEVYVDGSNDYHIMVSNPTTGNVTVHGVQIFNLRYFH